MKLFLPHHAGLTKSSARGVRSTLQTPLDSQKSLGGSPGGSLENLEEFSKIRTLSHTNTRPRARLLEFLLMQLKLISEHILNQLMFALKCL